MKATKTKKEKKSGASTGLGLAQLQSMVDNLPINVILAGLDLKIQYMNLASTKNLGMLQQFLPMKVSEMIGQSIDVFHNNPSHQRSLLSDDKNLPHLARIKVGTEILNLLVTAIYDKDKKYSGAMATWEIITEAVRIEAAKFELDGQVAAISKAQAVIEFKMDGTIVTANENFLKTLGYSLEEIKDKHHSLFVEEAYRQSSDYREFWAKLNRGEYVAAEFKRIGKGGREVWIQASYNPILDLNGKPFKVVKYATDTTQQKLTTADYSGQISAIGKSQAVIECKMDGTIVTANENFLKTPMPTFLSRSILRCCWVICRNWLLSRKSRERADELSRRNFRALGLTTSAIVVAAYRDLVHLPSVLQPGSQLRCRSCSPWRGTCS